MDFKCLDKCGNCCGPIPIPKSIYERNKGKLRQESLKNFMNAGNYVFVFNDDMKCGFLKNFKCSIYSDRPNVCQEYGLSIHLPCPYLKVNGEERNVGDKKRMEKQINKAQKETFAKLKLLRKIDVPKEFKYVQEKGL